MPTIADHILDREEEFYKSVGVSRLYDDDGSLNPDEVEEGDIVFVKTDYLYDGYFQNFVFPRIEQPFVLVSGVSSYQVGSNGDESYKNMLEDDKLIKWFCTNTPNYKSEKIIPLPIGFEEKEREGGNQELLFECYENKKSFKQKKTQILLPYHNFETNPDRKHLYEFLEKLPFVDAQKEQLSFNDYLKLLDDYKFIICLEGSGPDIHRNYESLLVGSIPVNIGNIIKNLFSYHNLPGQFVESWDSLNENQFKEFVEKEYNFDNVEKFLKIDYHAKLIRKIKNENRGI
jgi:hypothetical protein